MTRMGGGTYPAGPAPMMRLSGIRFKACLINLEAATYTSTLGSLGATSDPILMAMLDGPVYPK